MNLLIELHNAIELRWERILIKPDFHTIVKADNRKYYQFKQFTTPYDVETTEYDYLKWRIDECCLVNDNEICIITSSRMQGKQEQARRTK